MPSYNYDPNEIPEAQPNVQAFTSELDKQRTSSQDANDANWNLAKMNSMGNRLKEIADVKSEEEYGDRMQRQKDSADVLNRKYPGLQVPFSAPQYDSAAKIIYNNAMNRKAYEDMVASGPQDYLTKGTQFVKSMAAHVTDPAELGTMMVTGGFLKGISALGEAATSGLGQFGQSVGYGAAEMAGVEGVNALAAKQGQEHYSAKDYIENTLGGALAFEGGLHGVSRIFRGVRGFSGGFMEGLRGDGVRSEGLRSAVSQAAEGKTPDISPLMEEARMEETFKGSGDSAYQFSKFNPEKPLYSASEYAHDSLHEAPNAKIGEDFGEGFYATDNPYAANGVAGSKFLPHDGTVFEGQAHPETKLLHLDEVIPPELGEKLGAVGQTGREVLERAREEGHLETTKQYIADAGYDGLLHEGDSTDPQNHAIFFDKGSLEQTKAMAPDRDQVPKYSEGDIQSLMEREQTPERSMFHDPNLDEAINNYSQQNFKDPKLADLQAQADDAVKELDDLKAQGLLEPEEHQALTNDLKETTQRSNLLEKAHKYAISCIGKG